MLLSAEHICKNYGTRQLLRDASLYLSEREKIGLIGRNGIGKSTFLRILAGEEFPDSGTVTTQRNARIAYLSQNPSMDDGLTVLSQVFSGFLPEFREIKDYEVRAMLTRLGIPDPNARIGTLSGGQRKRVALAATLIHPADILILDEPTNHLDSEMTELLEERLRQFTGGLLMVTHDRYFLERVASKIVELDQGALYAYEANFSRYLELKAERLEMAEASERKRQTLLRRETQWIQRGARARGTKSRERIARYEALQEETGPESAEAVQLVTMQSRLGKKLITMDHVTKAFSGNTVLCDYSYTVQREDRIGIVGVNGAGKTTLLNLLAGRLQPDSGTVEIGQTVRIGYFSQEGRELCGTMRVFDFIQEIAAEVRTKEGTFSASQMLERFLFTGSLQQSPIEKLSGGERRRLYLLSILIAAPNILLLDEPTNDLDIETLMILEDYLAEFPGAVLAVSHDRYFLDKLASSIWAVSEGGHVTAYTGNYQDYLQKRPAAQIRQKAEEKTAKAPAAPRKKTRLSYGEQRELSTIDDEIAALEAKIRASEKACQQAASDYVRLMEETKTMEDLKAQLDQKTDRWFYLHELEEQLS